MPLNPAFTRAAAISEKTYILCILLYIYIVYDTLPAAFTGAGRLSNNKAVGKHLYPYRPIFLSFITNDK